MAKVRWYSFVPQEDDDFEEQDCPECAGRGDEDCLTCCGLGYV